VQEANPKGDSSTPVTLLVTAWGLSGYKDDWTYRYHTVSLCMDFTV
jgi:hypothetical protein